MIAVDEAQRLRELPAKSRKELLSRLELHVGRVLKLEMPSREGDGYYHHYRESYTVIGELLWLKRVDGGAIRVRLRGSSKKLKLKLTSSVSILTEGQWVLLHRAVEPELDGDGYDDDGGFIL